MGSFTKAEEAVHQPGGQRGAPLQDGRRRARPAAGMTGIPMDGVDGDGVQSHECPFCKGADHGKPKPAFMRDQERRMKRNEATPMLPGSLAFDLLDSVAE